MFCSLFNRQRRLLFGNFWGKRREQYTGLAAKPAQGCRAKLVLTVSCSQRGLCARLQSPLYELETF